MGLYGGDGNDLLDGGNDGDNDVLYGKVMTSCLAMVMMTGSRGPLVMTDSLVVMVMTY